MLISKSSDLKSFFEFLQVQHKTVNCPIIWSNAPNDISRQDNSVCGPVIHFVASSAAVMMASLDSLSISNIPPVMPWSPDNDPMSI